MDKQVEELKSNIEKETNRLFSLFNVTPEFVKDVDISFKDSTRDAYSVIHFEQGLLLRIYRGGKITTESSVNYDLNIDDYFQIVEKAKIISDKFKAVDSAVESALERIAVAKYTLMDCYFKR